MSDRTAYAFHAAVRTVSPTPAEPAAASDDLVAYMDEFVPILLAGQSLQSINPVLLMLTSSARTKVSIRSASRRRAF